MKTRTSLINLLILLPFCTFGQWNQIGQDINGEAEGDLFGRGLSISDDGNIIAVGGYLNDSNGQDSGHVRVYENIGGTWIQIGDDIQGEAAGDSSGFSLELNNLGNIVAIGASNNTGVNGEGSGHVRVYENIGGVWTQIGEDIDGEAASDSSGQELDLSSDGNILAIGANGSDENGNGSGHVRVFENIGGIWIQIGEDIDGEETEDRFGTSVSINDDGNIVAIGAREIGNTGYVRLFENINGNWVQIGADINGEEQGDQFGVSVSLNDDGNIVAIGGYSDEANGIDSGHVLVFENIGGTWIQIGEDINGEAASDFFGQSVSLNGDGSIVAVGAFLNDNENGFNSGSVQVYRNIGGVWTQIGDDIDGDAEGDGSGISVALNTNGGTLAISSWKNDTNGLDAGQVKVYGEATLRIEDNVFGEKIKMFPNPTYGISNIKFETVCKNVTLFVYDATGKVLKQETHSQTDSLQINTQDYSSGIYMIKIVSDYKYVDLKLIKR